MRWWWLQTTVRLEDFVSTNLTPTLGGSSRVSRRGVPSLGF